MRAPVEIPGIEAAAKTWHGWCPDVRHVRWMPYKPDGARQMRKIGRWQEQRLAGEDYSMWANCERPFMVVTDRPDFTAMADELRALRAENARLRAELSAAIGYMMNAAIDLDTGCTKATAITTINGGIKRARAALGDAS